jgi:riboflavin biosynthesis pyrimidine reductase
MSTLSPLEVLFELVRGVEVPLPRELAALYGPLRLPSPPDRPTVIGNFVTTLDGVVSLNVPGKAGGGPISGESPHDRLIMGLLRAVVDAVVVGAGTLRAVPRHRWTAAYAAPAFAGPYQSLRSSLGKGAPPLNVIVTARGEIDLGLPVFQSGEVPVLVVTTTEGAQRIDERALPPSTNVETGCGSDRLNAHAILGAVQRARPGRTILVEGGPQLLGDFFAAGCLDELFLTLAPQVAGRDGSVERPGLVAGRRFAPEQPLWGTLVSVRRGASHLFLRYAIGSAAC